MAIRTSTATRQAGSQKRREVFIDGGAQYNTRVLRSRLLLAVYVLLTTVSLLPIWWVRYQPLPDLSQHLAAASVLHNLSDPRFDLARYYELSLGLTPYWGYYGLVHLFAFPLGVETANRVVLSLYVAALPAGMGLLARRFARSPWLGLFTFPIVWNYNFTTGFIAFALGLAVLPWALVCFDRFCERATPGRAIAAVATGVAVFFVHLLPWGAWIGCAGLIGLLHRGQSLRAIAQRFLVWCAPTAIGVWVMLHGKGLNMGSVAQGITWRRYDAWSQVGQLFYWVWNNGSDFVVDLPVLVLVLVLLAAWGALKLSARRPVLTLHGLRAEACVLVALVAYLVLPRSVLSPGYWWGINIRFACIAAMFIALCVPGEIVGGRRFLLVPVVLVGLGFAALTTVRWVRANHFCAGYDELALQITPGSRVLFVLQEPWHSPEDRWHYVQTYYGIHQARFGGYMPYNFDEGFPLKYKVRYPAPTWRQMVFRWDRQARYYDYVLSFNHTGKSLFGAHLKEVTLVSSSGRWSLWKLPGPRIDQPPQPAYPSTWALQ